ncbi:MAG: excinuclease ABC subunit UvrC [Bacteroidales bacterium]|nr:excinuclease ABC subunit UvrC [Bacteroidales bacterium]
MQKEKLSGYIALMPSKPGIYQFVDSSGEILYIGKAKNLKKRVVSYFSGAQPGKTHVMLKRAVEIRHVIVDNESDALLLENNLIKKHQPRYNILLKDDKSFPWICIKAEPFPRVFITRNVVKDGSAYHGPYASSLMVKTLTELFRQIYKLRTCSLNLTESNISAGKFRVCLEYHIGNCKGPCAGLQGESEYLASTGDIRDILKGNISSVISHLKEEMMNLSAGMRFEEAQAVKDKIEILSGFRSKSAIVSAVVKNVDVFGYTSEGEYAYVNYLKVIEGAVVQAFTLELKIRLEEEKESILASAITEIRGRFSSDSPEIIVPFSPDIQLNTIRYTIPRAGEKLKLAELSERNAIYYKLEQKKRRAGKLKPGERTGKNLEKLRNDLHMSDLPVHIECFDNSNIMGTNPVAACVVFRNGQPCKKDYRHFNIKMVEGPDDFASMEEIVFRRYRRMLDEDIPLPQLVIIDGGKGQLSSAMKSLNKLGLSGSLTVIGIAKRLEEIFFSGDSVPIYIDKNSISLKIIQRLRNEAHRFGITFHRNKRSTSMLISELDSIKGIGPVAKEILLKRFGSVEKIREATPDELKEAVGVKKSELLLKSFQKPE